VSTKLEIYLYYVEYDNSKPEKCLPVVAVPDALKLVKDAVVLIERAQLTPEILVNLWQKKRVKSRS